MSVKNIERFIKDLSNDDKKVRQAACESLESEGQRLSASDIDVLKKAVKTLQNASNNDSDRGVKKKADSAYQTLSAYQKKLESQTTTPSWGSTSSEPQTKTPKTARKEGEPNPALEYILAETLNGTLSLTGELQSDSIQTTGIMKVKNLSNSEKVFDVNFSLDDKGLSSLEDSYHFNEIQPDEEQVVEYNVNIEKVDDLAIEFKEMIDTFPESNRDEGSNVLVFGQTMETKLKYSFTAKKTLKTFTVTKELPNGFDNVQVEEKSLGETKIDGQKVSWTLQDVQEGTSGNLVLKGSFKVDNLEDISTGVATVEFTSETDTHSGIKVSETREGRVKSTNFIDSDEVSEEPDNWLNKFVFENPSDIDVTLKYVKITNPSDNNSEVVSLQEPYLVSSKGTWESEEFKTFSESQPSFIVDFDLMVGSRVIVDTTSKLEVEQGSLRVANIVASKVYELSQVPSYRETPLPATVNIENIGAIAYSKLVITDKVPIHFLPPIKDDMVIKLVTEKEGEEVLNVDSDYQYSVEGNAEDSEIEKKVLIEVTKEVPPGGKIIWEYAPRAFKPLPEHTYDFNTHIEATLTEQAPPLPFDIPDDLTLTVLHERRNVTVGKTILPGSSKNVYEVELFYKNRGTATLKDLQIRDFVPSSFKMTNEKVDFIVENEAGEDTDNSKIESKDEKAPSDYDGSVKVWNFPSVKPDNKISIRYTIQGSGEFSMKQAQMTFT
jgi:hypothetical protein